MPISAILGLVVTMVIWLIIMITQPYSRWVGLAWMVVGLIIYVIYRRRNGLSLTQSAGKNLPEEG